MTLVDQGLSINKPAKLAGVSHSALYYQPKPRTVTPKPERVQAVKEQCMARTAYGYRRVTAMLHRKGLCINKKAVQRIMHLNGWLKPFHKRYRTRTGYTLPHPTHSEEYWQADMTKIWCGKDGWAYLFNVLDCCTREWLGYNFTQTCSTSDNEPSVTMALENHAPKTMQVPGLRFESFQHAQTVIQAAFVDYNNERIHSGVGYKTPREFYEKSLKKVSLQNQ